MDRFDQILESGFDKWAVGERLDDHKKRKKTGGAS
jgi:hypothetical protein